jgi:16S rRNA (cytidine1402-2'-O)-methyltransferase
MGTLYLVATPIGNLEDMSPRAVRVLRGASLIAAEDTRHTGKLLRHFEIQTPITSYFEHNKLQKLDAILQRLEQGDVALVSDAGTPAINDPGYELVRAALGAGYPVVPVPGPSAPLAALTVSGLPTDSFLYLGYLPHRKGERLKAVREVREMPYTLIFLESPYRVADALEDLLAELGDRRILVAREMTKMFEEYWRGTLSGAAAYFGAQPARGEFTLVIEGREKNSAGRWSPEELDEAIEMELGNGKPPSQVAGELAKRSGWKKREVYDLVNSRREG